MRESCKNISIFTQLGSFALGSRPAQQALHCRIGHHGSQGKGHCAADEEHDAYCKLLDPHRWWRWRWRHLQEGVLGAVLIVGTSERHQVHDDCRGNQLLRHAPRGPPVYIHSQLHSLACLAGIFFLSYGVRIAYCNGNTRFISSTRDSKD
jgi:hypothetical protein